MIKIGSGVLVPTATAHGEPWRIAGRVVRVLLGPGWLIVPATMLLARLLFLMAGDAYVFSWTTAALARPLRLHPRRREPLVGSDGGGRP